MADNANNDAASSSTASEQASSSTAISKAPSKKSNAADSLLSQLQQALGFGDRKDKKKERYQFWETQPVAQFNDGDSATVADGPVDEPKTVADVRQEPYTLPDSFEWCSCDMMDDKECKEVYELLSLNYVEDDDNMFRFNYSPEFLRWALCSPGFKKEWHLGVRVKSTRKLVGFIAGIPARVRANENTIDMVEINFLCVIKKLRAKRLAPVLIMEITRRVNLHNIWQAAYTAGVVLPKPVAVTRYWHRSLNPKKLIDIGFSKLQPRMTMARTIKFYKVADEPLTPGIRPMELKDVPQVHQLLNSYLERYQLASHFSEEEVAHWFRPQDDVVEAFVVEDKATGQITDLLSFYSLPSTVLGNPEHNLLRAAYMFYTVPGSVPISHLMQDALILARMKGYDVFNALDILQNIDFLKDLKFGPGDGYLQYYLYNWRVRQELTPQQVGFILL